MNFLFRFGNFHQGKNLNLKDRKKKKKVLNKLIWKLSLLKPSQSTALAGRGRNHVHVLVFE